MARRNPTQLAYRAIRIEGGLIPAEELARLTTLTEASKTEQTEQHYNIPKGLKLRDEIGRFWKIAHNLWQELQALRQRQDVDAHEVTTREFLLPLCRDVLGFTDITRSPSMLAGEHSYQIGHAALGRRIPLIFSAHDQQLDSANERFGELNPDTGKTRRRSPYMLAQEALNASDVALWGIVSNGLQLRILRDNPSLTRPAYVEVDLEKIFTEELYADFTAFWLLAHGSRFGTATSEPSDCAWERWRGSGQEVGETIRSNLRYQVADALRALGTGFLSHPANLELRTALQSEDGLTRQAFFEELLGLVYRFIFLATVEDRLDESAGQSLIFAPNTPADIQQRYLAGYSFSALRERAVRRSAHDRQSDLWQAQCISFNALATGEAALGLPALGGLFDSNQCLHLEAAQVENRHLLNAAFQLGYFRTKNGLTRVNYRDMGPEEFGSVYESLLELVPDIQGLSRPNTARLAFVGDDATDASTKGNTRKLTGSYYTPDSLVQELIKSALEPVIEQTVKANPKDPVTALLALTVCDPACGSGHFLLAAARRLADVVAKYRAAAEREGGSPTQGDYRHALRDVVSHCIYGVDKNPMAIQLAKAALWLEAYSPDRPLSFIDHHLQIGDALLGVLDPKVLEGGIPDEAFSVLSGDDKATASVLKRQNKVDLKSWKSMAAGDLFSRAEFAKHVEEADQLADDSLASIAAKRSAWMYAVSEAQGSVLARLADTYVAAFLAPKLPEDAPSIPLSGYLWGLFNGQDVKPEIETAARAICRRHSVFHWWLAFPHVASKGGFSVMLGNPPWERIKLQEEEFFATRSPLVAMAKNKAERGKRIELLKEGMLLHTLYPDVEAAEGLTPPSKAEILLHAEFISARRGAEAASLFAHSSGRFPLTGVGDVNTYALFAETFLQLISKSGRAGFIVPTGIATDDTTKAYFEHLAVGGRLRSLLCLENEEFVFRSVHHAFRFALLTLGGEPSGQPSELVFFARQPDQIHDKNRRFRLTQDDFCLINPNTRTCPVFRSKYDAELTKKIYREVPVLVEEGREVSKGRKESDKNPWGIRFQRMFDMSTDSGLFEDSAVSDAKLRLLTLYEAKMIHQFDHRWATYIDAPDKPEGLDTEDCSVQQKSDSDFAVRPRYWVEERQVLARIARVPARVATAWLTTHRDSAYGSSEPEKSLEFAIASWLAGEFMRRECTKRGSSLDSSARLLVEAHRAAVGWTERQYPPLMGALRWAKGGEDIASWMRWAKQDADFALTDTELDDLIAWQREFHGGGGDGTRIDALLRHLDCWMDRRSPRWLMGWRRNARSTDERTTIASVMPRTAQGDSVFLFSFPVEVTPQACAAFLGCLNSLIFDYVARQKVGGMNYSFYFMKQLPALPPDHYTSSDFDFIVPRVRELTYTAHDLKPWASDLAAYDLCSGVEHDQPVRWNPERRAQLRAELDAYYGHLYGLTRDELRYILDPADVVGADYPSETFRVLKESEIRTYGEYRTRRLVLEAWDRLVSGELTAETNPADIVFSDQGVISSPSEAEFAGLLFAMLSELQSPAQASALRTAFDAVALGYASVALTADQADHLQQLLVSTTTDIALRSKTQPFLERMAASGALRRVREGQLVKYAIGEGSLPKDVTCLPEHKELAVLLLALGAKYASNIGNAVEEVDSTGQDRSKTG